MNRLIVFAFSALLFVNQNLYSAPPVAEKQEKILEKHGDRRSDPYYWLNDRENPKVIDYLKKENAYTDSIMSPYKKMEESLYNEMVSKIKLADESAPYIINGYKYFYKTNEKSQYYVYYRQKLGSNKAELILDVDELGKKEKFTRVTNLAVSPDNKILAYAHDKVGRNKYTIYFKELSSGKLLKNFIADVSGSIVWLANSESILFVDQDKKTLRDDKIYSYHLKTGKKQLIYEEKDTTFTLGLDDSTNNKYVFLVSYSTKTSEVRFVDLTKPKIEVKLFAPKQKDVLYFPSDGGDKFYIYTNKDESTNFKVMTTSYESTSMDQWKDYISHRKDVYIQRVQFFKNFVVTVERQNGLNNIVVMNRKTEQKFNMDFNDPSYDAGITQNFQFDTDDLTFYYESLTTPESTYSFNMQTNSKTLIKQREILGGFKPEDYKSERVMISARDGVKVPVSIVYKKTTKLDGTAPGLVYSYGSYGASSDPYFSSIRLSLLDRGFVYAIAHVRGGSELGRTWYEDGKMFKKKNTFFDFIDSTEFLVKNQYIAQDKVFASGGSAGGLLMGAISNMRPDLYKGILAHVPFVDVVTTMLDDSIPLTTGEYDEWGNPNIKDQYEYMLSYSPYDQVKPQNYPNMLVTTGLHDSQVQYWEPAKWVAKLRTVKTGENLILLKTNMDAGHGGASGRFDRLKEEAFNFSFMFSLIGVK